MKAVGVIPARLGSSRFPGKPLAPLLGRTMIEHVYRRTALSTCLADTCVATCDDEIRQAVEAFGGRAVMTSASHQRASDRAADDIVHRADTLPRTRATVVEALGPAAMVDAAGVASNFERMVRIAGSTGIELGDRLERGSADARAELGLKHPPASLL